MARIQRQRVKWDPGSDAVIHRVYISQEEPTYDSPYAEFEMPVTEIILPEGFPYPIGEGDFYVGVSALDDLGNETDIVIVSTPFDFSPPGAPSNIIIEPYSG